MILLYLLLGLVTFGLLFVLAVAVERWKHLD
jgi:hypothetical protein